jgi:hypothetical protein
MYHKLFLCDKPFLKNFYKGAFKFPVELWLQYTDSRPVQCLPCGFWWRQYLSQFHLHFVSILGDKVYGRQTSLSIIV